MHRFVLMTSSFLALSTFGMTAAANGQDGEATPISDLVLYGVDRGTSTLVRCGFGDERYNVVDQIHLQDGTVLSDVRCLGYIPGRLDLYAVWNVSGSQSKLLKIDMFSAEAEMMQRDVSYGYITGMVGMHLDIWDHNRGHGNDCDRYDEDNTGNGGGANGNGGLDADDCWTFVVSSTSDSGDHDLLRIDPSTGRSYHLANLSRAYEGLAASYDEMLYGVHEGQIWKIDPVSGAESMVGEGSYAGLEALEFAFGKESPAISIPGVDASETAMGAMFGFSDSGDALLLVSDSSGVSQPFASPVNTMDLEGLVVISRYSDPRWDFDELGYD